MSVVALLTDFGVCDEYVGVMKGVILSIDPDATVVDLCHDIDPHDCLQASYMLAVTYSFFPAGTVFVVVVDPDVGSDREIAVFQTEGYTFLAPDNGVLTQVLDRSADGQAYFVDIEPFTENLSATFHGRDIFAPVAAKLALNTPIRNLGTAVAADRLMRLDRLEMPTHEEGELVGKVITIDHFGNLITNIDQKRLAAINEEGNFEITVGRLMIHGLARTYSDVPKGAPLALIGSRGFLEIAVCQGHAGAILRAMKGSVVRVSELSS